MFIDFEYEGDDITVGEFGIVNNRYVKYTGPLSGHKFHKHVIYIGLGLA